VEEHWRFLLRKAYEEARKSNDPSTRCGALIINKERRVLLADCNRIPNGISAFPDSWVRPIKYRRVEHAQRMVLNLAAKKSGVATEGLTMVCPWPACAACARGIIAAGIARLVMHEDAFRKTPSRWHEEARMARDFFAEAGVEVISCAGTIGGVAIPFDGSLWSP